jgi:hypothetical protein
VRAAFVDDEACVAEWVNASTVIADNGGPLVKGAHLARLRTAAAGSFLVVSSLPGTDGGGDVNIHLARVSAGLYGASKADAKAVAVAYANLLRTADGLPAVLTGGRLYAVENISGPFWVPDGAEPRYVVDATFVFQPL